MTTMTGGQAAVRALEMDGVEHVFGLIGSATMEMFDALYDTKEIQFIGVHDERTGCHMADGYARMRGTPGVFLAGQNGPGTTNLVTGLAQAKAANSPLVSLAGALATGHRYRDAFQEVDQDALFQPITKKTWTVTAADRVPEMMRMAFREAMAPRRGPVHLNFPRDVLSAEAEMGAFQTPAQYRPSLAAAGAPEAIAEASRRLAQAKQPVIIAGGGIKSTGASTACLELAGLLNCPVVTSPGHGDAIPHGHALNAGQMGPRGNPVASKLVKEADVILALGTRVGFNSTFYSYDNINENADIIQVEIAPEAIGRFFPVALGILGDAPLVAVQLRTEIQKIENRRTADQWVQDFQAARKAFLETRDREADVRTVPIQPSGLFKTLRDSLPKNAVVTLDAGTLCLQATDALTYWEPQSLFTPLDFGLVGFSFACGLGAKLAAPDRPVISLMGDGGFGMTVSELSTAVDHGINTITVVMNNGCWGAEKAYQRDFFNGRYIGADVSSPPFDKLAELYGAKGYRAETLDDLRGALEAALETDKPVVIDTAVDPNALYSFRRDSFKHRGG